MARTPTLTAARRRLRAAAARIFPSRDDDYRAWLAETFPHVRWKDAARPSTLDLSIHQVETGTSVLNRLAPSRTPREHAGKAKRSASYASKQPWKGRYHGAGQRGDKTRHLTQHQADEIARIEDVLGWTADPKRLAGFLERQTGARTLTSSLTRKQAADVITGLRRLLEHYQSRSETA